MKKLGKKIIKQSKVLLASVFFLLPTCFSLCSLTEKPNLPISTKNEQFGVASYYHNKFNGRKTSSGEIFRNDSLTAAHKTLPLGTWVRVTNLKNDSIVIVKINDRLPKSSKRSIDLSTKAAKQLNFIKAGLAKVKIELLQEEIADSCKIQIQ